MRSNWNAAYREERGNVRRNVASARKPNAIRVFDRKRKKEKFDLQIHLSRAICRHLQNLKSISKRRHKHSGGVELKTLITKEEIERERAIRDGIDSVKGKSLPGDLRG
ncbi:hypothetical protein K0M31_002720 [Melipona bicolor]|uniref:Uncharacterized protein n=1 Tax=Melipona bicolor TaxID=60889 RepID=A0AA40KPT5_9HYME|nr:hypothetical protein K0M31_002720 [Melipona bicolor]